MLLLDYMSIYIKRFCLVLLSFDCPWGTNILNIWGGQTFFVGCSGAYDDVDEEMVVSEANIFESKPSKLSAGARIFRGP